MKENGYPSQLCFRGANFYPPKTQVRSEGLKKKDALNAMRHSPIAMPFTSTYGNVVLLLAEKRKGLKDSPRLSDNRMKKAKSMLTSSVCDGVKDGLYSKEGFFGPV
ncbi:hypothetical protein CEXT_425371 [Caerostris extrusa]|uniref:Uncharacterized protein n=1 Tax=Caerostris extrusa TaxID=172846 RepID=A0AAV4UXB5_CAEEX|nr:hypothetical protein CEXT_425371 [Caerostris extrusa]